jgi:hypothetical protein
MPRDTLEATSAQIGSPLTAAVPVPPGPFGVGLFVESNAGITAIGGDMIIFQGVPHVAWCELEGPIVYDDNNGQHTAFIWHGPYVARWNGGDWQLLTPTGALADAFDTGIPIGSPVPDGGRGPGWRRAPKLATDGTHLFCGVPGAMTDDPLDPPGNTAGIRVYLTHWSIYGFRLDGDAWTILSADGVGDMFPLSINGGDMYENGSPDVGPAHWDISASPDAPGQCYFAISDFGPSIATVSGADSFSHLVVAGTDLPETALEIFRGTDTLHGGTISPATVSLAGGGPTLTLYYEPGAGFPLSVDFVHDKVLVWTPTLGTGEEIDATSLGIPYVTANIGAPAVTEVDGIRYLVFFGNFDFGGGDIRWADIVQTGDPSSPPADLQHLSTPALSRFSSDLLVAGDTVTADVAGTTDLDLVLLRGGGLGYVPAPVIVEPHNYWIGLNTRDVLTTDGPDFVAQLDRQCRAPSVGWTIYPLPDSDQSSGRPVVYQDAIWWLSINDRITLTTPPRVMRTPICRGCADCPRNGLHVWRRI